MICNVAPGTTRSSPASPQPIPESSDAKMSRRPILSGDSVVGTAQMTPDAEAHHLGHDHDAEPAQQSELRYDILKRGDQQAREEKIEGYE